MGGSDSNYQVIYRGESLENFREGEWVFFQRAKEFGGGYWFGAHTPIASCWSLTALPLCLRGLNILSPMTRCR